MKHDETELFVFAVMTNTREIKPLYVYMVEKRSRSRKIISECPQECLDTKRLTA
uniref:Transposase n=1 Tax=Heterorhabditis bacteriophora TaxID=37862 RepID=A0A1I7XSJ1_HETBA